MEPNLNTSYLWSVSKWSKKKNKHHPKLNDKSSLQGSLAELGVYAQKMLLLNPDELLCPSKPPKKAELAGKRSQQTAFIWNEKWKTEDYQSKEKWWSVYSLEFWKTPFWFSRNFRHCWGCRGLQFKTKDSLTWEQGSCFSFMCPSISCCLWKSLSITGNPQRFLVVVA